VTVSESFRIFWPPARRRTKLPLIPETSNEPSPNHKINQRQLERGLSKLQAFRNRYLQAVENYRRIKAQIDQGVGDDPDVHAAAALVLGRSARAESKALDDYVRATAAYKRTHLFGLYRPRVMAGRDMARPLVLQEVAPGNEAPADIIP